MDLVFQSNRTIEHGVDNGGLLLLLFCVHAIASAVFVFGELGRS